MPSDSMTFNTVPGRFGRQPLHQPSSRSSGRGLALQHPSCPLPAGGRRAPAQGTPAQPLTWEELLGQR